MPYTLPDLNSTTLQPIGHWGRWIGLTIAGAAFVSLLGVARLLPLPTALQLAAALIAASAAWRLLALRSHELRMARAFSLNAERLRRTIDDAPIGMALVGLDGRWLRINAALARMVGYHTDALHEMTFQQITHPEDLAKDLDLLQETIKGTIPGYVLEKRYRHRDGHEVPVELHVSLIRDQDGAPAHFVSQIVDLTRRVADERELLRQEAAFAALVEEADDVVIRYDRDLRIVYANPATTRGSGISPHELIGRRVDEIGTDPELAARWNAALSRVLATGISEKLEYTYPHPDGGPREWQARFTVERGLVGQAAGVFVVSRDITDLHLANESLQRREQEFAALAENAEEMIVRYDLAGRYRYANPAALALIKRSLGEVLGRKPADLYAVPPQVAGAWEARNAQAIRERRTIKITLTTPTPEGDRTYESAATPEFDALGRPVSLLVISRDITAARKAADEIERREQEWVALMEGADDIIAKYDLDFRIRFMNSAITRLSGKPPAYFIGKTNREARLPPNLVALCDNTMRQVLATGNPATVDFDFPGADGSRHFLARVTLIRNADGKPYSVLVISRDITQRRGFEIERERLLEELTRSQAAIKTLEGLLPTCAWCHKIRDERGEWEQMEQYISRRTDAEFSHGLCPDCAVTMLGQE